MDLDLFRSMFVEHQSTSEYKDIALQGVGQEHYFYILLAIFLLTTSWINVL
jgi:hypothetical protein